MSDSATMYLLGAPLEKELSDAMNGSMSSGALIMPSQTVLTKLMDYTPRDKVSFTGSARFRVMRAKNFLLVSLLAGGLNFDLVWSPITARRTGEPLIGEPAKKDHMLMNFILVDNLNIVRAIRQSTISPQCSRAIWRAQNELMAQPVSEVGQHSEMMALFGRFPTSIPDALFHEVCDLGD